MTVKNGTVVATDPAADGAQVLVSNSSLTLEEVALTVEGGSYGIVTNGMEENNAIALRDSTLSVPDGHGIYFPSSGSVTIENSDITAKSVGVQMCAGSLSVSGDDTTIATTGDPQQKTEGDGVISDGAAISIVEREGYKDLGLVSIEGGAFSSASLSKAVKAYMFNNANKVEEGWGAATDVVKLSGGTFEDQSFRAYLMGESAVAVSEDATSYSVYPSEAEALANGGGYKVEVDGHSWVFFSEEAAEKFAGENGSGDPGDQPVVTPVTWKVAFDDGIASTEDEVETVVNGKTVAKPADPTRAGYTIGGWFSDEACTQAYDFAKPVVANITLYAKWNAYVPPAPDPTYAAEVVETGNGSVAVEPAKAEAGEEVVVTATPDEGYVVGTVAVTDSDGEAVEVTEGANGAYVFEMPEGGATVEVSFAWDNPYVDVPGSEWYYPAVEYVTVNGIMKGYAPEFDTFGAYDWLSRGMMVQVLYNMAGAPEVAYAGTFEDVPEGSAYAEAIEWAASEGIATGFGPEFTSFGPDDPVTREQMAVFMCRYAEWAGEDVTADDSDIAGYPDAGEVSSWATAEMAWAVNEGVINGVDGAELQPAAPSVRAYVAQMLMNYLER